MARIRAVLRRAHSMPPSRDAPAGERLKFGRFVFNSDRRELIDAGEIVTPLSYGEYLLLSAFLHRPNIVLTRDQLLDITRGRAANLFDRSIDNQVSRLRRKIEDDPKEPKIIQTIWGGGYKFVGNVEPDLMRFFPGSLKGQLMLLTLVALLVSQVASFLFILDDQKVEDEKRMVPQCYYAHRNGEGRCRNDAS